MSYLVSYKNYKPCFNKSSYIAQGVVIVGNVTIGSYSSIWFNSVLRGDVNSITIGDRTNIQDGTIIHTSRNDNGSTSIGNNVTVGHKALIHACTIQDNAFIGMASIIMDKAIVEKFALVAAGSLVSSNKIVKSKELWLGRPAKFIRYVTNLELDYMQNNVKHYVNLAQEYKRF